MYTKGYFTDNCLSSEPEEYGWNRTDPNQNNTGGGGGGGVTKPISSVPLFS